MMKQHFILRSFAWFLLLWCVLITGSKTGLVVYFSYLVLTIFQRNLVLSRPRLRSVFFTLFILFAAAVTPFLQNSYLTLILWVTGKIPGAERLLVLFNDFYAALGEDGSYRIHAWENAFQIIKTSPFFGIGIGTYSDVANAVAGNKVIAHNTYLQLFAEWGIPLTLLLFVFILYLVMSSFLITRGAQSWHLFNEALVIFLIASMSISLNNARLFWISLGAILYCRLQVHAEGDRLDDEDSLPIDNAVRKTHKEIP
jgi:O-antigen ligase